MMRFARPICAAVALLASAASSFSQTSLQGGPGAPGHAPMYSGQGSPVILQDSGPAGGGKPGVGLSELLVAARGTGTPPYVAQGTGPLGTLGCFYDAPITNVAGYHYLCFSPNAQGGPLIAYGAAGGATPLGLQLGMNGVVVPFSTATNGIVVAATPVGNAINGALLFDNAGILGNGLAAGDCTTAFSTTINFTCTKTNGTAFGALATVVAGTGVATATAINVGSAGAVVVNGGALGTPSSGVGTNLTGTAAGLTAGNVTTNANLTGAVTSTGNATSLGSFSSANLRGALTDETGTGAAYFQGGDIGTPSAGVGTSLTALNASNLGSGTVPAARTSGHQNGTATNDNAATGEIGEYITASVVQGSAASVTNGTAANVTSISLTAGDWDVWGIVAYIPGASTNYTLLTASVSTTSATTGVIGQLGRTDAAFGAGAVGGSNNGISVLPIRISLAGTTTVYLVADAFFTVSTMSAYGQIAARRRR